jgi:hypothetical protein
MARVTNGHVPQQLRQPEAPFYPGMTRTSAKYGEFTTDEAYQDPVRCGQPWSDWNLKWDPERYQPPANKFGVKTADALPTERVFAPAGMFGQLHAGKARGDEMRTKVFARYFNPLL